MQVGRTMKSSLLRRQLSGALLVGESPFEMRRACGPDYFACGCLVTDYFACGCLVTATFPCNFVSFSAILVWFCPAAIAVAFQKAADKTKNGDCGFVSTERSIKVDAQAGLISTDQRNVVAAEQDTAVPSENVASDTVGSCSLLSRAVSAGGVRSPASSSSDEVPIVAAGTEKVLAPSTTDALIDISEAVGSTSRNSHANEDVTLGSGSSPVPPESLVREKHRTARTATEVYSDVTPHHASNTESLEETCTVAEPRADCKRALEEEKATAVELCLERRPSVSEKPTNGSSHGGNRKPERQDTKRSGGSTVDRRSPPVPSKRSQFSPRNGFAEDITERVSCGTRPSSPHVKAVERLEATLTDRRFSQWQLYPWDILSTTDPWSRSEATCSRFLPRVVQLSSGPSRLKENDDPWQILSPKAKHIAPFDALGGYGHTKEQR